MVSIARRAPARVPPRNGETYVLLVVEDSIRHYSSFLPVIYSEVMKLTQSIVSEGVNLYQLMSSRSTFLLY